MTRKKRHHKFIDSDNYLRFERHGQDAADGRPLSTIRATSPLFEKLAKGSTITISDTAENNGTYTIEDISDDGLTATVRTVLFTNEAQPAGEISYQDPDNVNHRIEIDAVVLSGLTFRRDVATVVAGTADSLEDLPVGSAFTVSGTDDNDGTYTVKSNDGTTIEIESIRLTDEGVDPDDGTFFDAYTQTRVVFAAANKTITVEQNAGAGPAPNTFAGLIVGDKIEVANSPNNNGTFTITAISDDGSRVTVAEDLVDATDTDGLTITGDGNPYAYTSDVHLEVTNNASPLRDVIKAVNAAGVAGVEVAGYFSDFTVGQDVEIRGIGTVTISRISADGSEITIEEDINGIMANVHGAALGALPAVLPEGDTGNLVAPARIRVASAKGTIESQTYFKADTNRPPISDRSAPFNWSEHHRRRARVRKSHPCHQGDHAREDRNGGWAGSKYGSRRKGHSAFARCAGYHGGEHLSVR